MDWDILNTLNRLNKYIKYNLIDWIRDKNFGTRNQELGMRDYVVGILIGLNILIILNRPNRLNTLNTHKMTCHKKLKCHKN